MKTGAVIVAAGMSSRMGKFKPLLALGGSTIIGTAVAALWSAGVADITVVTGNEAQKLENYFADTGVICLHNKDYKTTEMFDSAKIGLDYLKDKCGRVFFLPADVPLFSKKSLFLMSEFMDNSDCKILSPVCGGKMGHPILIDSGAIPFLTNFCGDGGLKCAIEAYSGRKECIEIDDIGMTIDADRPSDYLKLKSICGGGPADDTDTV